ncbi:MAG: TetR family transcriptional regulator [Phycisphaerales bacterium]|nr:TetR family transcriptional regulator [Phycisphaerales bacterium]
MSSEESETRKKLLSAAWALMEQRRGKDVRMQDVAKRAKVSRQAVYLHFRNRADLLIATTRHIDQVSDLDGRVASYKAAATGLAAMDLYIAFWGNYLPVIYNMAKALLAEYDTDADAAAAWDDRMRALRSGCQETIERIAGEGKLSANWTIKTAADFFWSLLSVHHWELLTKTCGWSTEAYIATTQATLRATVCKA